MEEAKVTPFFQRLQPKGTLSKIEDGYIKKGLIKMENETEIIEPTEGKRLPTCLKLLKSHVDGLSEIADARGLTKTAIIDQALSVAISNFNDTTFIDQMLAETKNFWFTRDLERVKQLMPLEKAKNLSPYQKAYLNFKLKDLADRQRVFEALSLVTELDQISTMNAVLEKASKLQDGRLLGFNINKIAHEIRAKLTPLQVQYLTLKLGSETIEKLQQLTINKFPKIEIFKATEESPMNPAVETILAVLSISRATWDALPDGTKQQIHDAVAKGQLELARGLVAGAMGVVGTIVGTVKTVMGKK